jgi:hypothetical protein
MVEIAAKAYEASEHLTAFAERSEDIERVSKRRKAWLSRPTSVRAGCMSAVSLEL